MAEERTVLLGHLGTDHSPADGCHLLAHARPLLGGNFAGMEGGIVYQGLQVSSMMIPG
ncbi:hypothetical protein ACTMU2_15500 [Cupriavidus basilensis]